MAILFFLSFQSDSTKADTLPWCCNSNHLFFNEKLSPVKSRSRAEYKWGLQEKNLLFISRLFYTVQYIGYLPYTNLTIKKVPFASLKT